MGEGTTKAPDATARPHSEQNFAVGDNCVPHPTHHKANGAPQAWQNLA